MVLAGAGLAAVDTHSGVPMWTSDVGGDGPAPDTGRTRMVVAAETVTVLGADGRVHGFTLRTGAPLWVQPAVRGAALQGVVTDGRTVVASGDLIEVYSIDLATGTSRADDNVDALYYEIVAVRAEVVYTRKPRSVSAVQVPSA